jgi:hypothetical protein
MYRRAPKCIALAEPHDTVTRRASRAALASIAAKTGSSSPGDELMTLSTSEVAVCCSSDSVRSAVRWRNSLSSRAFSMAMTA